MPATRAQRKKEAENGKPASPARALPAPRKVMKRKPRNAVRNTSPAVASGSETEHTEQSVEAATQSGEASRTQSTEPESTQQSTSETQTSPSNNPISSIPVASAVPAVEPASQSAPTATVSPALAVTPQGQSATTQSSATQTAPAASASPALAVTPQGQYATVHSSASQSAPAASGSPALAVNPQGQSTTTQSSATQTAPAASASPALAVISSQGPSGVAVATSLRATGNPAVDNRPKYARVHIYTEGVFERFYYLKPATVNLFVPMRKLGEALNNLATQYPGGSPKQVLTRSIGTQTAQSAGVKRKATDDLDQPQASSRVRFNDASLQKTPAQINGHRIVGYKPAPLYDANGMIRLSQPDIAIYSDEEPQTALVLHTGQEDQGTQLSSQSTLVDNTLPQTPSRSRWGFGSLLNTASKFVPGLGRRAAPATPSIQRPIAATPATNSTPQILRAQHPRTEPHRNTKDVGSDQGTSTIERPHSTRPNTKTSRPPQPNKVSKSRPFQPREMRQAQRRAEQAEAALSEAERHKAQLERIKTQKRELDESVAEQKRILEEEQKRLEDDVTRDESEAALKAVEEWRAEKEANPGLKRKRPASPKVIPNPKGCSFGFDPRYFVVDDYSSDEEESSSPTSPTPERPHKQPRLSSPPVLEGDTTKAQPYTGAFFSDSTPTHQGGNVFGELAVSTSAADKASAFQKSVAATPKAAKTPKSPPKTADGHIITNLSGHFTIPDDDSDEENSELLDSASPQADKTVDKDATSTSKSSAPASPQPAAPQQSNQSPAATGAVHERSSQPSSAAASATAADKGKAPMWSQPPPAAPSPSHATLPSLPTADFDSLTAARAKALKHAPKKPSTLRESSRINSSPLAPTEVLADPSETPVPTSPTVRRASSDEVIAEMESSVANNPPPPLEQVLGVLADKAPNGQGKSPVKATALSKKNQAPGQNFPASVEPSKAVTEVPPRRVIHVPSKRGRDETLIEWEGQTVPKWQADLIMENWTEEDNEVDLTEDFKLFCKENNRPVYETQDDRFSQEDIDAAADEEVANYHNWVATGKMSLTA